MMTGRRVVQRCRERLCRHVGTLLVAVEVLKEKSTQGTLFIHIRKTDLFDY